MLDITPDSAPPSPSVTPGGFYFYEVEFKAGRKGLYRANARHLLRSGSFVIVQADRGEDLGRLRRLIDPRKVNTDKIQKRIVRLASATEVCELVHKAEEEEKAVVVCIQKVREHGLPLETTSAEYQFDRNKLTFFYKSEGRVDFRELVRDLFKLYRVRIWMQKAEK